MMGKVYSVHVRYYAQVNFFLIACPHYLIYIIKALAIASNKKPYAFVLRKIMFCPTLLCVSWNESEIFIVFVRKEWVLLCYVQWIPAIQVTSENGKLEIESSSLKNVLRYGF